MADYKAVKLMHCWNEYCFPSSWWASSWCVCMVLMWWWGGGWWSSSWWNGWGWWEGKTLAGYTLTLPTIVDVWAWGTSMSNWGDTCVWEYIAKWWRAWWVGPQYWMSWFWFWACTRTGCRCYWWGWCTFATSSTWALWYMSWMWGWWWWGSHYNSSSYCRWCPWCCWWGNGWNYWCNWCNASWFWWGWGWSWSNGTAWGTGWCGLAIICYPTDWSWWYKDLIGWTKTTSWTYTVHCFCRGWFLRKCDDDTYSFKYLAVWPWGHGWICGWWGWWWWEVLSWVVTWTKSKSISITIWSPTTTYYTACCTKIGVFVTARWGLRWQNWWNGTNTPWGIAGNWCFGWNWFTGAGTSYWVSWWGWWAWWRWCDWSYDKCWWSWWQWLWGYWGGGWWGSSCCNRTWCWGYGTDWWWNGWLNSAAWCPATTCWSGGWGAWTYKTTYWAWASWLVEICYPSDWSGWFVCATWGTKSLVNWWCRHRFTASWTFCIVC